MKRKLLIVGSVAAILGISFFAMDFLSSHKEEPERKVVAETKRFVKTSLVSYRDIPTELVAYGRVRSALPLEISAEVSGKVLQGDVPLIAGQRFAANALLFKIDDTEARLRLQASKSSFLKDLAGILPDLKIDFSESYPAWQAYFNQIETDKPLPELPKHRNNQEKTFLATKNIYNTYYTIKSTEINLEKHEVRAPFEGTISEVFLQIGSFVNPGTKVAKTLKTSTLELSVAVEPADIQWVKVGSDVVVSNETNELQRKGKIVRIGEVLNTNTQALDVFVQLFPTASQKIYEGMYLRATLPGTQVRNAVEIPRAALVDNERLYVLANDSLLTMRHVQVHKLNAETAIISGLKEGEEIVAEPIIGAYEGMKIFSLRTKESISTAQQNSNAENNEGV